jgi:T4 superinfection immunity protein
MVELFMALIGLFVGIVKLGFGLVTLALALLYFVPSIIALVGHKRNAGWIVAANLLLGWTMIAWVVVLIWALVSERANQVVYVQRPWG